MQPIRKVIADVMRTLGAYRDDDLAEREIVERWLRGIFMAASIKKYSGIAIHATNDGSALEALLHTNGASCSTDRIRPLHIRHAESLKAYLYARAESNQPLPHRGSVDLGTFEETVGNIAFIVRVYLTSVGETDAYNLILKYITN
ncbi:MAG TPA: hypothetical protein VN397_01655 [Candidatus Methylomirabilis sp.]|nr:hypothetical protein [Candidatus Methylomirabilis sp.]